MHFMQLKGSSMHAACDLNLSSTHERCVLLRTPVSGVNSLPILAHASEHSRSSSVSTSSRLARDVSRVASICTVDAKFRPAVWRIIAEPTMNAVFCYARNLNTVDCECATPGFIATGIEQYQVG